MKVETRTMESKHYPDLQFNNVQVGKARGFVSNGIKRFLLDGQMSLNAVDSVKFGRELHLQVYTKDFFVQEEANESEYRRVEIYLDADMIDKLIACLEELQSGISNRAD